ncbi:DUF4316 domain-containing protein [Christensenellaceae bacterium OttesenSCG-928-K19]|nr:DUF4316 domain-containing protein [Christensenellaceae bacterium OttesenSCG-928-K19]
MNEKDNYLKSAELATEQNYNMIDGIPNNAPPTRPTPKRKPLDKVKEQTRQSRTQELER